MFDCLLSAVVTQVCLPQTTVGSNQSKLAAGIAHHQQFVINKLLDPKGHQILP